MTLTEKILARAAGKARVQAGENVWANADVLMTHDVCGPGTIGVFKREFGKSAKVWDRDKVVIIPDHYIFTADSKSNRNVDILRDFVKEQGITYFYDVIDDPDGHWHFDPSKGMLKRQYGSNYAGVCHTALPQKGHTRPGEILFGTDSHTTMACEAGGKNGIFEFDAQTRAVVDYRCNLNGTRTAYGLIERERKEKFVYELAVDISKLEPTVACHPDPGRRKLAKELGNIKLD